MFNILIFTIKGESMKKIIITATLFSMAFASFTSFAKNNYFASPQDPSGKLILVSNKVTQSLFPVTLLSINGSEVAHKDTTVWLKPGTYDLNFSTVIDHKYAGGNGLNVRRTNTRHDQLNKSLNITVEANKVYYIAYDAKDENNDNWSPIIWKEK
jgi:hypothetical protein